MRVTCSVRPICSEHERERNSQAGRQADRQTQTDRPTDRQTHSERASERETVCVRACVRVTCSVRPICSAIDMKRFEKTVSCTGSARLGIPALVGAQQRARGRVGDDGARDAVPHELPRRQPRALVVGARLKRKAASERGAGVGLARL